MLSAAEVVESAEVRVELAVGHCLAEQVGSLAVDTPDETFAVPGDDTHLMAHSSNRVLNLKGADMQGSAPKGVKVGIPLGTGENSRYEPEADHFVSWEAVCRDSEAYKLGDSHWNLRE